MPAPSKDQTALLQDNTVLLFRIQVLTLLLFDLSSVISIVFSLFTVSEKIRYAIVLNGTTTGMILLLLLARRIFKSSRALNRIHFIFTLLIVIMIQALTPNFSIIVTMALLGSLLLMIFIQFNGAYVYIFLSLYLVIILSFAFMKPFFSVSLGLGFYIVSFFSVLIALITSQLGIKRFRRHETLLLEKISTIQDQMEEIQNLNLNTVKEHERLDFVFEASHDGIIDIEPSSGSVHMSARSSQILGFECRDLDTLETALSDHFEDSKRSVFFNEWFEIKKSGDRSFTQECYYNLTDKRIRLKFNFLAYTSTVDESRHILLVIKDVTKEFEQADRIYKTAYKDSLTGLMNRLALVKYAEDYSGSYDEAGILILDIDNFRFINDSFGYQIGDRLLKAIGRSLQADKYGYMKAVARLSSNDFAVFLNSRVDEMTLFNNIQRDYGQYSLDDIDIKLNYSAGLAYFSDSDSSADGVIKKAEIAMYKAKERGKKGICVFSDDLNDEINRHMDIMNELEDAIASREFRLNYQPKIDSTTNRLIGFESLIRWESPRLGIIPPDEFIPLAEQSGLIHLLGEFVLRESCRFLKRISEYIGEDEDFRISVNVSAVQLLNSGFYRTFFDILEEIDVPPYLIGLEVTETAVMENMEYVCHQLDQFRAKGVRVYLDDFGTGYSSLNYLTLLPIDVLKIDKTFIDNIHIERRQHQVVKLIISLAEVFSLIVIAEGVETVEQLDVLKKLDCRIYQGYYFSRPLPEEDAYLYLLGNKSGH